MHILIFTWETSKDDGKLLTCLYLRLVFTSDGVGVGVVVGVIRELMT